MKRFFDCVVAVLGLLALLPLGLVLAMAVAVDSGFPLLFCQQRVGRGGRDFRLVKFRTMTVLKSAEQGAFDAGSTSRVTRAGRFLRKAKLDELPQLWNVLVGDMSLVGPRPEVRKWVEVYPERWARVHTMRPGITDPASIEFRNEEEILALATNPEATYREVILPQKLALYINYVDRHSFWGDLGILVKTVCVVLVAGAPKS